MTTNNKQPTNRIVTSFSTDQYVKTLMAYTYGHMVPLQTTISETQLGEKVCSLKIDEQVPDQLVEPAKQVCINGNQRFTNEVLNKKDK